MEDRDIDKGLGRDGQVGGLSRLARGLKQFAQTARAAANGATTWSAAADLALQARAGVEDGKYAVSCLMDSKPKFQEQTLNWIASLRACDPGRALEIFVHYINPQPSGLLKQLEGIGVHLVEVKPFGKGAAVYCNKLLQLPTFEGTDFDEVILSDTDIAFLRSPARFAGSGCVRAKVVDMPNPQEGALLQLLARAGFGDTSLTGRPDFASGERTHPFNCNGGLYILPGDIVPEIGRRWVEWSRFCLHQKDILGDRLLHSDQLGFMLAMIEGGFKFDALPVTANFPTQFPAGSYSKLPKRAITALHYHDHVDHQGELLFTGNAAVDKSIQRANMQIRAGKKALKLDTTLQPAA